VQQAAPPSLRLLSDSAPHGGGGRKGVVGRREPDVRRRLRPRRRRRSTDCTAVTWRRIAVEVEPGAEGGGVGVYGEGERGEGAEMGNGAMVQWSESTWPRGCSPAAVLPRRASRENGKRGMGGLIRREVVSSFGKCGDGMERRRDGRGREGVKEGGREGEGGAS
jgi:hypothetical protein